MKRICILTAAAALTAGCAPNSVLELKEERAPKRFIADAPYEEVYRTLYYALDHCGPEGVIAASSDVRGNLYPESGLGEISLFYNNMGDKSVLAHVEVRDLDRRQTAVTAYTASIGRWDEYDRTLRYWLAHPSDADNPPDCHPPA